MLEMLSNLFKIDYQNEVHSYRWLWASISLVQFTIAYYVFVYEHFSIPIYQVNLSVYVISSIYFAFRVGKGKAIITSNYLHGAITLSALNWLLMSVATYQVFGANIAAEKVLLIGFFSTLICFSTNTALLIISTLPIIIIDIAFKLLIRELDSIDLLISSAKFPLFIVVMIYTTLHFNRELRDSNENNILLNAELTKLKNTDPLTGLNNRRVFEDKLAYAISVHKRLAQPVSLMILDVDYFKNYNDSLGHPAGDQCLIKLAKLLQGRLKRQSDVLARIGGEEFAVVLPATNLEQCRELAQSLISTITEGKIKHPNSSVSDLVTVSIGIACLDENTDDNWINLYKNADNALYRAKEAGRNQVAS